MPPALLLSCLPSLCPPWLCLSVGSIEPLTIQTLDSSIFCDRTTSPMDSPSCSQLIAERTDNASPASTPARRSFFRYFPNHKRCGIAITLRSLREQMLTIITFFRVYLSVFFFIIAPHVTYGELRGCLDQFSYFMSFHDALDRSLTLLCLSLT